MSTSLPRGLTGAGALQIESLSLLAIIGSIDAVIFMGQVHSQRAADICIIAYQDDNLMTEETRKVHAAVM